MWYVFPQLDGLGRSYMAKKYAIKSLGEASDYLAHPILGERLVECTQLVLDVENRSADQIFGFPDVLKFHSSMTLFAHVADHPSVFSRALEKYYQAKPDSGTISLLDK